MAGSIVLSITYGIEVKHKDDPHIVIAEEGVRAMAACGNAGSYIGTFAFITCVNSY